MQITSKMDKLSARIIICVLVFANGALCRPRHSRQTSSFMVLSNYSAPCESFSTSLPHVSLTEQDKLELFHALGGYIVPTLMAVDREAARESFSNLIPLPQDLQAGLEEFAPSKPKALLKHTLTTYLQRRQEQADGQDPETRKKGPESHIRDPESHIRDPESHIRDPESHISDPESHIPDPHSQDPDYNAMLRHVPKSLSEDLENHRIRHSRDVENIDNGDENSDEIDAEEDSKINKNAKQNSKDSKEKDTKEKAKQEKVKATKKKVEEEEIILPVEKTLIPPVQKSSFGTSYLENCFMRKSPSPADPEYLSMCSACTATTDLNLDMFPSIINEVTCIQGDINCLFVEGVAHGKCQQVSMPFNGLRKREGQCVLALKEGDTVVADEWTVETFMIRVGCECTVHRDSFFVQFL